MEEAPTPPIVETLTQIVVEVPIQIIVEAPTPPIVEAPTPPIVEAPTPPRVEAPTRTSPETPTLQTTLKILATNLGRGMVPKILAKTKYLRGDHLALALLQIHQDLDQTPLLTICSPPTCQTRTRIINGIC